MLNYTLAKISTYTVYDWYTCKGWGGEWGIHEPIVYFTQSLSPDNTKNHEVREFYGHGKNNGFVSYVYTNKQYSFFSLCS